MFRRAVYALACMLALSLPAAAQEQTGQITGTITDTSGAVLPGVTVEANNLTTGAVAASTSTDGSGVYRFPALRPAKYEIVAKLTGFSSAKSQPIDLRLGQILTLPLSLAVGGQSETISVTAESPIIDTKQSAKAFSINAEQIAKLPKGRDFSSLVTQAPGANQEGRQGQGISIDGAAAAENRFIIDGVETTNPENGLQAKRLLTDFIDEVQVKSSGYNAEYGGAVGGVINVVTKTGSNAFHGEAGFYYTNDFSDLGTVPTNRPGYSSNDPRATLRLSPADVTVAEYITYPADKYNQWDPGFQIGGPIAKDRLWFFGGYQPSLANTERTANLSDGTPTTKENDVNRQNLTANVTGQISNSTRFKVAYNQSGTSDKGLLPGLSLPTENGTSSPLTVFDVETITPNWSVSGNLDVVATSNFYLGVRGGYYLQDEYTNNVPIGPNFGFETGNVGMPGVPAEFQNRQGVWTFGSSTGNFATAENSYKRTMVQADATYYANFAGQHTFKGGVQFDRLSNTVDEGETGNRVRLFWDRSFSDMRGPFGYYRVRSNGFDPARGFITDGNISNTNVGLFIQDSWTVADRVTLNLGLRTETEKVPSYTTEGGIAETAIDWGFGDKLAPRVGVVWDMLGDGKNKVYGNWGVFYDTFKLELPRGSFGGDKWLEYWYTLDQPDYTNLLVSGCPPACPGTLILGPVDFRHPSNSLEDSTIDPALDPYRLQEASIGFERELNPRISVGARYIHKQVDKAIEDVGILDEQQNEIYYIANPGYGLGAKTFSPDLVLADMPKAVRDYDAVEFLFTKRLADNWALTTSYLWSKLEGNYSGLTQSDEAAGYGFRSSPNVGRNFDNVLMTYGQDGQPVFGPLGTDRPHQFKAQFIYDFNFGTTTGVNYRIGSGVPVTREAAAVEGNNFPIQYLGRASDGRTDSLSQTDLFVAHTLKIGGDRRIQVSVNIQNVFNQDTEVNRWYSEISSSSGAAVDFEDTDFFAGRVNFQEEIANLGDPRIYVDPRFLQSSAFQFGREIRFGVKFLF
jgi:outer membrane receptor protein involved in Fe transport